MLGAIAGDIIGQPYEFRPIKTTEFELINCNKNVFTDDSVMTIAVCMGIMNAGLDAEDKKIYEEIQESMQKYGRAFPYAGYGASFDRWIYSENPKPYNSWGNGSAMRVSSVAWLFSDNLEKALSVAALSAKITHNHLEGIKGAVAAAHCIWMALNGFTKDRIKSEVEAKYYLLDSTCDEIRPDYQFDVSCMGTMPVAIQCFLEGNNYEEVVRLAVSMGGDSDTLACIAGGIAEAYYGLPPYIAGMTMRVLPEKLRRDVERFREKTVLCTWDWLSR